MKKFEINKVYTDKSYYDGDSNVWSMKVLNRTAKTITAEITKPSGKTEIKKFRVIELGNCENVELKGLYVGFSAN